MTATPIDAASLLTALLALPRSERCVRLRAAGDVRAVLLALSDESERLAVSEVSKALEATEMLAALCDEAGCDGARARVYRARAQSLAYAGRYEDALPHYEAARLAAELGGDALEAARALMSSLHSLASLGRLDEAIAAGQRAREAFLAAGEPRWAARADVNLGATHQMCDHPSAALVHLDRARPHFADDPVTLAKIDSNRGHALVNLDNFTAAEDAFHAALPTFEKEELHWAAATVEGNLAELSCRQGRLQEALFRYERARRHMEADAAEADLARLLAEQAEAYAIIGLHRDALAAFETAVPELEKHGLTVERAKALAGKGRALLHLGRTDEAESSLDAAAEALDQLGQATARARLDLVRGELLARRGRSDDARDLLAASLAALRERPAERAVARFHLAKLAADAGDARRADGYLSDALTDAERVDLAPLLADLHHLRGKVRSAQGDATFAAGEFRRAVEQIERVRGALQAERYRAAFHGQRTAAYEDLVLAALDCGDESGVREAFETVERAKSRVLLDQVSGAVDLAAPRAAETDAAQRELTERVARLRGRLNYLYSRVLDRAESAPAQEEERRKELRGSESELRELESRLATARGVSTLFAPTADTDAVRAALAADARLIEYFVAGDELLAFVIGGDETRVFRRLAPLAAAAEAVERVQFQIRRALRPGATEGARGERLLADARRELASAYDLFVRPLRPALREATRLTIVAHGPLHQLPFCALYDGEGYLVDSFELNQSPSASLLVRKPAPENGASLRSLVVGYGDAAAPLIENEADAVAGILPAPTALLGLAATANRFSAACGQADIIHLACHGAFSSENPLASGLRLADRWLTVRDAYDLRMRARLVTLSGCETGRLGVSGGDELLGLVRGFLAAGASALLVSLWMVHDESTTEFMTCFYENWCYNADRGFRTQTAARSLRAAQRAGASRRAHPAFWAPFVLIGEA